MQSAFATCSHFLAHLMYLPLSYTTYQANCLAQISSQHGIPDSPTSSPPPFHSHRTPPRGPGALPRAPEVGGRVRGANQSPFLHGVERHHEELLHTAVGVGPQAHSACPLAQERE